MRRPQNGRNKSVKVPPTQSRGRWNCWTLERHTHSTVKSLAKSMKNFLNQKVPMSWNVVRGRWSCDTMRPERHAPAIRLERSWCEGPTLRRQRPQQWTGRWVAPAAAPPARNSGYCCHSFFFFMKILSLTTSKKMEPTERVFANICRVFSAGMIPVGRMTTMAGRNVLFVL